jgi:hypothetical protein
MSNSAYREYVFAGFAIKNRIFIFQVRLQPHASEGMLNEWCFDTHKHMLAVIKFCFNFFLKYQ